MSHKRSGGSLPTKASKPHVTAELLNVRAADPETRSASRCATPSERAKNRGQRHPGRGGAHPQHRHPVLSKPT